MSKYAGTKTEKNLMDAFAGESQARNKYTYYASQAKKAGYEQLAALYLETADQVLLSLCETVGARLRADNVLCNCICVELKTWDFRVHSHQITLSAPTDSTSLIYKKACQILREFWDLTPVRLIGVRTSKIAGDEFTQLNLFDSPGKQKQRAFEQTVDQIRSRYGVDSIKRASFLSDSSITDHAASKQKHLNKGKTYDSDTSSALPDNTT